ncbi:MAG TPA: PH domain-containing protein [Blastocatellia bacterium]|nr:PH domain-containing protein [Blastocatellia bacterium]
MYCNHCGNKLPAGSRFCNRCGQKTLGSAPQQRSPNIPPPPLTRPARRTMRFEDDYEDYEDQDVESLEEDDEEYDEYEAIEEDFDDDEEDRDRVIFSISPVFYGVASRYIVAITLSLIATALIGFLSGTFFSQFSFLMALGISSVLMLNPIYHHLQHNRTIYTLTNVKLEIRSGFFSKTSHNIPLRHIQDVTVNQTLRERMLGIGDVVIDSAVIEGTMPLHNIKNPRKYANLILDELQYWN